jgi:hypothetical protein
MDIQSWAIIPSQQRIKGGNLGLPSSPSCWFTERTTADGTPRPGILHFNPEYDFLQISWHKGVVERTDPLEWFSISFEKSPTTLARRVVFLNLAVEANDLNVGLYLFQSLQLDPEVRAALIESFTQLHEVSFAYLMQSRKEVLQDGEFVYGMLDLTEHWPELALSSLP